MARTDRTSYAILGMLTIRPMSGYEMKKTMAETTDYFWTESYGQLYPILAKLARDKLVSVESKLNGARVSKVYAITQRGRDALAQWLQDPPGEPLRRSEILLKLFFGQNVPNEVNLQHIKLHRQRAIERHKNCEKILQRLQQEGKQHDPNYVYWYIVLRGGLIGAEAQIKWCDEVVQLLEQK
jgi:PadR family transcriptional regulator, regulatory protein AphA